MRRHGHKGELALEAMKKEGPIESPVRCKWEPAEK